MKSKIGLLVLFFLLGIGTKAQGHFYYYKGEKIPLTLNKQRVNFRASIDFDKTELEKSNFKVTLLTEDKTTFFGEIEISSENYQKSVDNIRDVKGVSNVFPHFVKTETESIGTSDVFYVKLKNISDLALLERDASEIGFTIVNPVPNMPLWIILRLDGDVKMTSVEVINKLFEKGVYADIDPAFMFNFRANCTNDSNFSSLWGLKNTSYPGIDINVCPAWSITTGSGVKIAILDQGIDTNHLDLNANIHSVSYNAQNGTSPSVFLGGEHGTHVAGTVAAIKDNNLQVVGVAPSSKLMAVSHSLGLTPNVSAELADGIAWAWQNGADVINNSWGDQGGAFYNQLHSSILENAIIDAVTLGRNGKGMVVVFASGNYAPVMDYPANFHDDILTVGAIKEDGYKASFSGFGDKLDVVAPGVGIWSTKPNNQIKSGNGTSMASPHVAGVAGLVLSVNPNLTGQKVRDIIESTSQKLKPNTYTYSTHTGRTNGTWNNQMGYGLVDAYAAVQKAKQMMKPDLHIRDFVLDFGQEPNNGILGWFFKHKYWNSLDVWNRRSNDNGTAHQNVHYLNFPQNHINIRIKNRGDAPSTAQDSVRLHWAKAGTNLSWPMHWDGGLSYNNTPLGGIVATKAIPVLQPGESTVVKIPWSSVPNPNKYGAIFENSESFSLLARVISEEDPMTFTEGFNLLTNVKNNNNIAWKNTTVLGLRRYYPVPIGDVILVGNPVAVLKKYDLIFKLDDEDEGKPIYQESEVTVKLDPVLYQAWVRGGKQSYNLKQSAVSQELIVMGDEAALKNLIFEPEEIGALGIEFNFLTKEITAKESHLYHIYQKDIVENELVGGSSFLIEKTDREIFFANSGGDKEVGIGESVVLQASEIGESATYNWYDSEGELVHTGKDYEMSVQENKDLVLEVIADSDGYKDYDEMSLKLKPNAIEVITPNPASILVDVYYTINNNEASYYLKIVSLYGGTSFDTVVYPLIVDEDKVTIDVTAFGLGVYKVMMYCEGELVDAKNLLIE